MWNIKPVSDEDAQGALRDLYKQDIEGSGYVRNVSRAWTYRPELGGHWQQLLKMIRSNMRLRPFELVTLVASREIGCVYCMLAHGAVLHKNGFTAQQIIACLEDHHNAGLSPLEVHMMDYAGKICSNENPDTRADTDLLRQDGLDDQQITDITLAVVARNFISRFFNALGAEPDLELQQQEPELWDYLKDWQKTHS
jgi:uncharacterized peroxidase-related enzyme